MSDRSAPIDAHPGVTSYLEMERRYYAALVARSQYQDEAFVTADNAEHVVGTYAGHEAFDYERWLLGGVTIGDGALAVEYGCGPGRMLRRMSRLFSRVDGIDISQEVLAVAARRCADLAVPPRLYLTDGASVPTDGPARYDTAYSVICLQHICVYSIRFQILQGLFDALKPGGMLTFQMGYAPGHANMVDYEIDYVEAHATNGAVDVAVLHPAEIAGDLQRIGFETMAFALTPAGPGDSHGAWIFVRAVKPGTGAALAGIDLASWAPYGFGLLLPDNAAVTQSRWMQRSHGVLHRRRQLHRRVVELEQTMRTIRAAHHDPTTTS